MLVQLTQDKIGRLQGLGATTVNAGKLGRWCSFYEASQYGTVRAETVLQWLQALYNSHRSSGRAGQ